MPCRLNADPGIFGRRSRDGFDEADEIRVRTNSLADSELRGRPVHLAPLVCTVCALTTRKRDFRFQSRRRLGSVSRQFHGIQDRSDRRQSPLSEPLDGAFGQRPREIWSVLSPTQWINQSTRAISRTGHTGVTSAYGLLWWVAADDEDLVPAGTFTAFGFGGNYLTIMPALCPINSLTKVPDL